MTLKYPNCLICQELKKLGLDDQEINNQHEGKYILSIDYYDEKTLEAIKKILKKHGVKLWRE